MMMSVLDSE